MPQVLFISRWWEWFIATVRGPVRTEDGGSVGLNSRESVGLNFQKAVTERGPVVERGSPGRSEIGGRPPGLARFRGPGLFQSDSRPFLPLREFDPTFAGEMIQMKRLALALTVAAAATLAGLGAWPRPPRRRRRKRKKP